MRPLASIVACALPLGVLLVGCGDGGSGCNVRADACGEGPSLSGGGRDMGDPHEDERLSDYHAQEQEYWDQQYRKQEDSQRQESSSADNGDSDSEGLPDLRAEDSRPGMKRQWYNNIDVTKFSAGGPGQDAMRRQSQRQGDPPGLAR